MRLDADHSRVDEGAEKPLEDGCVPAADRMRRLFTADDRVVLKFEYHWLATDDPKAARPGEAPGVPVDETAKDGGGKPPWHVGQRS